MYNFTHITNIVYTVQPYGNFESLADPVIDSFEQLCRDTFYDSPIKDKFRDDVDIDINSHDGTATFMFSVTDVERIGRDNIANLLNTIASAFYDFNEDYKKFTEVL